MKFAFGIVVCCLSQFVTVGMKAMLAMRVDKLTPYLLIFSTQSPTTWLRYRISQYLMEGCSLRGKD